VTHKNRAEKTFICLCEDITLEDVIEAIDEGFTTIEEIKRHLRVGMGICQGRTCLRLIATIIAQKTKQPINTIKSSRIRPPIKPVQYSVLASDIHESEE
jgi:bacterioferritin-associated ferredoxin